MPVLNRLLFSIALLAIASFVYAKAPVELLHNGTLDGWAVSPSDAETAEHWKVEEGVIIGENPNKAASILWTKAQYGDFELTLEYRTPSDYYDSGVFVRGEDYQVQIGISGSLQIDLTGCIYAPVDGRGGYPAKSDSVTANQRLGEWNKLRMRVVGDRIQTFLNGAPIVDYTTLKLPSRGPIGLQLHAGHHMRLLFRNLSLRKISPSSDAAAN